MLRRSLLLNSEMFRSTSCIYLLLFIAAIFNWNTVIAQTKFSATATSSIPENQNFNLSFTLQNSKGKNLQLPSINDFTIVGGPSTSSNTTIMNGNVSQSETYTYVLRPKKQGSFKIGKASINAGGTILYSNEVTITVTPPSAQKQKQQNQNDPFNDPFFNDPFGSGQQQESQTSIDDLKKQIKDDVFVKVVLSKNSVYQGEMLTATYKLYFRQNLSGFNLSKSPSMEGFWAKIA